MTDQQDKQEEIKVPEKAPAPEIDAENFGAETAPEQKEAERDEIISEELKREIEKMEMDDSLKEEAKKEAKKLEFLDYDGRMEVLLKAAEAKGVVYAVKMAKDTNDFYFLDKCHDVFARNGYYEQFKK